MGADSWWANTKTGPQSGFGPSWRLQGHACVLEGSGSGGLQIGGDPNHAREGQGTVVSRRHEDLHLLCPHAV